MQDYCVACGSPVPEGQMVCYECLHKYGLEQPQRRESVEEGDLPMPPRGQNRLYSQAERRLRDTVITFENGNRIEIPEIREVSVEPDGLEATLYVDDSGDILIKNIYAQTATLSAYSSPFMESLNAAWGAIKDDFELADEEEYIATDPISYDELMEGYCGDN